MCRDPQAVYDMNIMAIKLAEDPEVRLPVIVASDGYLHFSSKTPCTNICKIAKMFMHLLVNVLQNYATMFWIRNNPITVGALYE